MVDAYSFWLAPHTHPPVKLLTLPVCCTGGNWAVIEERRRIARSAFARSEPTSTTWTEADPAVRARYSCPMRQLHGLWGAQDRKHAQDSDRQL